jgi:rhodanese-related sulfurtransferase
LPRTIDDVLADARARLDRVSVLTAFTELSAGALVVDIRPGWQREREGEVPGSLIIERNHLEWRLDPTSGARIPEAVDHDVRVLVLCSEGYTSSLAAAALQELGLHRATDVEGGFHAWQGAGLPTVPGGTEVEHRVAPT